MIHNLVLLKVNIGTKDFDLNIFLQKYLVEDCSSVGKRKKVSKHFVQNSALAIVKTDYLKNMRLIMNKMSAKCNWENLLSHVMAKYLKITCRIC